nr:hypothetical protein [Tanacetum cinerariifolium]
MVNTRQSTLAFFDPAFDEAVQLAVNALLPGFTDQITNEHRHNGAGIDAENWIAHIEKLFEVLGCADEFKARLARYKFEGDALNWWKAFKQAKGGETYVATLSWKGFRLSSRSMRESITLFFKRMVNSLWALSDWILDGIVNTEFADVAQVANGGRNVELLHERGGVNNKRNRDGDHIQSANKNNNQRGYGQRGNDVNALLPSLTAQITNELRQNGAGSNDDQPLTIHTCCGLTGHMAKDCPKNNRGDGNDKRPDVKGKVYSLTRDQAANSSGTVTGTLFKNGRAVFVLFDTSAIHSMISVSLSKYINTLGFLSLTEYFLRPRIRRLSLQ